MSETDRIPVSHGAPLRRDTLPIGVVCLSVPGLWVIVSAFGLFVRMGLDEVQLYACLLLLLQPCHRAVLWKG